ncbi:hypothetical protein AVEN_88057-1, partial [Araneus ventricosus]
VRSRLLDSAEDSRCMWVWCTLNLTSWVKRPPTGVVTKFEEGVGASSGVVLVI